MNYIYNRVEHGMDLELARQTADWFTHRRLVGGIGNITTITINGKVGVVLYRNHTMVLHRIGRDTINITLYDVETSLSETRTL